MADEGLEIVLSPLQLAAVLQGESVEASSCTSSVFWGAASVVGGALELVGAAGLILTPEPTTITKIAGGALALHGSDTASAGLIQIASCRTRTTLTTQGVAAAAKALGANPETAASVAFAVEVAVPLMAGFVGAARAIAIRRGAISLAAEEAAGGHTIARHVARTEAQLRQRLVNQPGIPAASSFRNLREAERAVTAVVRANRAAIETWAKSATTAQKLTLTYPVGRDVGYGVVRGSAQLVNMSKVILVLRKTVAQNRVYFVLTSFPTL